MPELPEVEAVCRTLSKRLVGQRVVCTEIRRDDVVRGQSHLDGQTLDRIDRHGKQLALIGNNGTAVCVHLGMSGSLRADGLIDLPHTHVVWSLEDGQTLALRDPRRFGGVWTYSSSEALQAARWDALGPDALHITPSQLLKQLQATRRAIKTALLDQAVVAGLGNIYVDELLHRAGLNPLTPSSAIGAEAVPRLVGMMRRLLSRAIDAGGSTLRDYTDGNGQAGGFQLQHRVYGRTGQTCQTCDEPLITIALAQRRTVYCPKCQFLPKKERTSSSS